MKPTEFSTLLKEMQTLFPNANICPDDQSKTVWFRVLSDLDFKQAEAAVLRHACTRKFPPSIAEIRDQAAQVTAPDRRSWLDGWGDVQRAIHRWGMHRPKEALDELGKSDPMTAKVAELLGWQNLCVSENQSVDRANFRQCYETMQSREKESAMLPPALKMMIGEVSGKLALEGGKTS